MKLGLFFTVLVLATTSAVHAQDRSAAKPAKPAVSAAPAVMPLVDAEVKKLDLAKGLIVLKHGELPNLGMPTMTMGFDVAAKKMLHGLKVGDKIKFQAEMVGGKVTVT